MPNFRAEDDLWLAEAYAAVTVDAAVGTDQNGATFWGKIRDGYIEKGGSAGRTAVSLQNRFNRYLQTDVNKYIGMLTSTFREYHSGWSLQDYYNDAKRRYVCKYLKPFKFEDVWTVLKENLVKFPPMSWILGFSVPCSFAMTTTTTTMLVLVLVLTRVKKLSDVLRLFLQRLCNDLFLLV